ncbi:MAG TPA: hypothetical protein VK338_00300 [Candidatus Nitrosocosmicus sp.]|nr:hypothetical protein [Candidatus Nitrosocosmicus sp.]
MAKYLKSIILFVIILGLIISAFSFGVHWHGRLEKQFLSDPYNTIRCFGLNNFKETYQLNCYSPKKNNFQFNSKLQCRTTMNHQMDNSNPYNTGFNEYVTIKADNIEFKLDINDERNSITRSTEPGERTKEPYKLIVNDTHLVQGIRNTKLNDIFRSEYEFITLSKKTGKGMRVWNNTDDHHPQSDSIASFYFQCE